MRILHVVPGSLPAREQRDAERDATKALATEARHLRKSLPKKVGIDCLVTPGSTATEISACATRSNAELIVMGRGGGRILRDAFLGSTSERVVRQARLPVLVVRLPPRATYCRPALALDLDEAAHEVVRLMLRVLPSPRPRVAVIHAYDVPYGGQVGAALFQRTRNYLRRRDLVVPIASGRAPKTQSRAFLRTRIDSGFLNYRSQPLS